MLIAWLILPIAIMILFGFNDTRSKQNFEWQGFTLKWYRHLFDKSDLTTAVVNSLTIALLSTLITTVLGTFAGLALGRYRFRGKGSTNLVLFMAISCPEIVMGASLLSMFVTFNLPRGYLTILVAHVMFSIAFVAVTVRARVVGLDPAVEEAAQDLGASPWTRFRLVTLPMIMPGVLAGRCWRSCCRSTTSSSPTSPAAPPSPSRCGSTAPPGRAHRRRSTSWARSSSRSAS